MSASPPAAPPTILLYTEEQRGNLLVESPVVGMLSDISGAEKLVAVHDPHSRITFLYRIDHGTGNLDAVAIIDQDPAEFDGKRRLTINGTAYRMGTPESACRLLQGRTRWIQDKGSVLSVLLRNAASRHHGFAARQVHRDRVRHIPDGVPIEPLPRVPNPPAPAAASEGATLARPGHTK
ncbi:MULTISPECIES: hypothetical protein [Bordetella]|uniref:Uncharacterized protein n=1 Tax=Bordetella petrii TaxID=94624 RepID=A0ABT7VXQ7_9BORD|nr:MULTISPECIES: hypothetical protein [Bordetella]MDM9557721.1 hypothetical protein [Bordetella petrii]